MCFTRYKTWFALYSTQDHQKSSLFSSVTAIFLQVQHDTCCVIWRIYIGVWPIYTAGIDLGQLMHVLYPLCNLICAIFNSRPSEELTFQLELLLFRCKCSMIHVCDMAHPHRCVANMCSWDRFRADHACFIPAVQPDLHYTQLKTIRRTRF